MTLAYYVVQVHTTTILRSAYLQVHLLRYIFKEGPVASAWPGLCMNCLSSLSWESSQKKIVQWDEILYGGTFSCLWLMLLECEHVMILLLMFFTSFLQIHFSGKMVCSEGETRLKKSQA